MIEVIPFEDEVYSVRTATEADGKPLVWVYSFMLGSMLFDGGCANAANEFGRFVSEKRPQFLVVSHTHEDHWGGCALAEPICSILAREAVHKTLMDPPVIKEFFAYVWGQPAPVEKPLPLPDSIEAEGFRFRVVELPGHGENMIGLYEPDRRWLLSADAVPQPSKKQVAMTDENVPRMISTMEKIQSMDVELLFDGHLGPIREPKKHIQKRIDYLKEVQTKVKELHAQGLSVPEIEASLNFEKPWYVDLTERRFGIDYLITSLLSEE